MLRLLGRLFSGIAWCVFTHRNNALIADAVAENLDRFEQILFCSIIPRCDSYNLSHDELPRALIHNFPWDRINATIRKHHRTDSDAVRFVAEMYMILDFVHFY